jgi:hypothetical protein
MQHATQVRVGWQRRQCKVRHWLIIEIPSYLIHLGPNSSIDQSSALGVDQFRMIQRKVGAEDRIAHFGVGVPTGPPRPENSVFTLALSIFSVLTRLAGTGRAL